MKIPGSAMLIIAPLKRLRILLGISFLLLWPIHSKKDFRYEPIIGLVWITGEGFQALSFYFFCFQIAIQWINEIEETSNEERNNNTDKN